MNGYLEKWDWETLDELFRKLGFGGYYDFVELLYGLISENIPNGEELVNTFREKKTSLKTIMMVAGSAVSPMKKEAVVDDVDWDEEIPAWQAVLLIGKEEGCHFILEEKPDWNKGDTIIIHAYHHKKKEGDGE